jgi:hypothetical protein
VLPLPEVLVGSAASHFDGDGNLLDPDIRALVVRLVEALADWTDRLRRRDAA